MCKAPLHSFADISGSCWGEAGRRTDSSEAGSFTWKLKVTLEKLRGCLVCFLRGKMGVWHRRGDKRKLSLLSSTLPACLCAKAEGFLRAH